MNKILKHFTYHEQWIGTWDRTLKAAPVFVVGARVREFTESGEIRGEREDVMGALKLLIDKASTNAARFDKTLSDFSHRSEASRAIDELSKYETVEYQKGTYRLHRVAETRAGLVNCLNITVENLVALTDMIAADCGVLPSNANRLAFLRTMSAVVATRLDVCESLAGEVHVAMGLAHAVTDLMTELDDEAGISAEIVTGIQVIRENMTALLRLAIHLT